ncbi:MAG: tail fiber domain-containing protein [Chitinophagaceae bacterium]
MKQLNFLIVFAFAVLLLQAQNVGIGTTSPLALLHVADSSVVFTAIGDVPSASASNTPVTGPGRRMMWYAPKAAFRVGYVDGVQWDTDSIGKYSFAAGYDARASGTHAIAIGGGTIASNFGSLAIGFNNTASGIQSTAMGSGNKATGSVATAMGNINTASGNSATAMGSSTTASGSSSTSMGFYTSATNISATAMGDHTLASGQYATSMGLNTAASGEAATAMGGGTSASALYAVAMGVNTTASAQSSLATGQFTIASGLAAVSMGINTTASGNRSFAAGTNLSTNGKQGAFFFGDSDPFNRGLRVVGTPDQYVARFNGGYYLISSNSGADIGVQLPFGQNSWTAASDVRLKENFLPVNGESFLQKIEKMPLSSWNYKTQDPKTFRHYGPMAQDFYAAFGNDKLGRIGCDTLINQQDFLGVSFIAIQALEKRTAALKAENENLKMKNEELEARLRKLENVMLKN